MTSTCAEYSKIARETARFAFQGGTGPGARCIYTQDCCAHFILYMTSSLLINTVNHSGQLELEPGVTTRMQEKLTIKY